MKNWILKHKLNWAATSNLSSDIQLFCSQKTLIFLETKKLNYYVSCFTSAFFQNYILFLENSEDFEKQAKNFDQTFCTGIYMTNPWV